MGTVRRLVLVVMILSGLALPTAVSAAEPDPTPEVVEPSPKPEVVEPSPAPVVVEPSPSPSAEDPGPTPAEAGPTVTPTPVPTPEPSPTPPAPDPPPVPPTCEWVVPDATDGTLTLDVPTVQAGTHVLGTLTDFAFWPRRLIGGGSGEIFVSCTPWTPMGEAEVIWWQDAPFFLVDIPAGTAPGTYPISVMFYEGPQEVHQGGTLVRLSATVSVTTGPVAATPGNACQMPATPSAVGRLVGDAVEPIGGPLTLGLADVPADTLAYFNEYDELWFLACLDGRAVVVLQTIQDGPIELALPTGIGAGPSALRVLGLARGELVSWERTVTFAGSRTPARPTLPATGSALVPVGVVALLLVAVGAVAVRARRPGPPRDSTAG